MSELTFISEAFTPDTFAFEVTKLIHFALNAAAASARGLEKSGDRLGTPIKPIINKKEEVQSSKYE